MKPASASSKKPAPTRPDRAQSQEKKDRLAKALRRNLLRRKAAASSDA